jgi:pimeloyl-ACP methyl ester carboxylesterase
MVRAELERGYADPTRATHAIDRYARPFATDAGRDALVRHIAALDTRETDALGSRLSELSVPTTVIWGAQDPFLPVSLGQRLADAIPGATLDVIADARHFLPEETPRQVADSLTALLGR